MHTNNQHHNVIQKYNGINGRWIWIWAGLWLLMTLGLMLAVTPVELSVALSLKGSWNSAFGGFIQHWGRKPASVLVIAAAFLLTSKHQRTLRPHLTRASAALLVQFLLHPAILTNVLKLLSGRIRPLHLEADAANFTPFYSWSAGLGDFAFPSGHVAIAMILSPCVIQLYLLRRYGACVALAAVTLVWGGVMAWGRVMYGAHYLSDVLFSLGMGIAMGPVSLYAADHILQRINRHKTS